MQIEWRNQKNKDNGQNINFARDDKNPEYFAIRAAVRIYLWSFRMGAPPHEPPGIFKNARDLRKYVTTTMLSSHIWYCALLVLQHQQR